MPYSKNYEILPGCEKHNYETNPTGIVPVGDPQLEIKFDHRSYLDMIYRFC
jgi:hypothetical protein